MSNKNSKDSIHSRDSSLTVSAGSSIRVISIRSVWIWTALMWASAITYHLTSGDPAVFMFACIYFTGMLSLVLTILSKKNTKDIHECSDEGAK